MQALHDYYGETAAMTDPGRWRARLAALPDDVPGLCEAIQGFVIHRNWAPAYGWTVPEARMADAQARSVRAILERCLDLDPRPLTELRPPEKRFAGTCRDFTLILCAALRVKGVPARARCGFGRYFDAERFEDHWVCEHWDDDRGTWVLTDAQLDSLQLDIVKPSFSPLDVPRSEFVVAGEAWRSCRDGGEDPGLFGIFDIRGLDFVFGNVLRDFAALNRVEVLPWDAFGLERLVAPGAEIPDALLHRVDEVARLTRAPDTHYEAIRALYVEGEGLSVGSEVRNWQMGVDEAIPVD